MRTQQQLQALLSGIPGVKKAYFQPAKNLTLEYPCIKYKRDDIDATHADNFPYKLTTVYQLMVIDYDPDSSIVKAVAQLPGTNFERSYTKNNLNHDVYTINF